MVEKPDSNATRSTDVDMGSFEGKYPDSLFKKPFVVNDVTVGYVAKDTGDMVVIFSEVNSNTRYDIPRSELVSEGGTIELRHPSALESYKKTKDAPLPEERLRPSAQEIKQIANEPAVVGQQLEKPKTTPDRIMQESNQLSTAPRPETTVVATPEGYSEPSEPEIITKIKSAVVDLKKMLHFGTQVATSKAKRAKEQMEEKHAEMDADRIADMGVLAVKFNEDFDDLLRQIGTRSYEEQARIYNGLITLMDNQRELAVARRDLAMRLRESAIGTAPQDTVNKPIDKDQTTFTQFDSSTA